MSKDLDNFNDENETDQGGSIADPEGALMDSITDIDGAIEAMLFVTDEPVSAISISKILEKPVSEVQDALNRISNGLAERSSGIQLREVAGGWRLCTHPAYHDLIEKYVVSWDVRKLSGAALETLAIIAYMQPATRNTISSIRGVSSDSSVASLIEKGLVKEVGSADAPGNPTLYGTTKAFLEKFGLRSTDDLVDIAEFAPDEQSRALIAERLSASKSDVAISEEQAMQAISQVAGAVEKIDFDSLEFDFDQE